MRATTAALRSLRRGAQLSPVFRMAQRSYTLKAPNVNQPYIPERKDLPPPPVLDNSTGKVSESHWEPIGSWGEEKVRSAAANHVLSTWGPSGPAANQLLLERGEGVYVYDSNGKEYLDISSQAVCTNIGHTVPPQIKDAINKQMDSLSMVYGGLGLVEVRCRLAQLLGEILPGDINGFLFPTGGGEANEAAIRIARRFTGKEKIITQYRSYHGGTTSSLSATGDFRRWFAEAGNSGFVKMFNPHPFGFSWPGTEEEKSEMLLHMLDEQIRMENPDSIAAIMLEPIVGAGGTLVPPRGYFEGVRALCDKYDILLIADEVMMGFGRTGKFFSFQHFPGVIPDIVTSAKGLTASILPLAMVAMRQPIKDFLYDNPLGWGATYANHPLGLACAYESVKHIIKEDLVGRAASFERLMITEMQLLVEKHNSVRQARAVGMFGCFDLVGRDGNNIQQYQDASPKRVVRFRQAMLDNGLLGLFRPPLLHIAPPLIITEEQLKDGFARLDTALETLDH